MKATRLLAVFSAFMRSTYGTNRFACILLIIRLSFVSPNSLYLIILMLSGKEITPYTPRMISRIQTAVPNGFSYKTITIEADATSGLPSFNIIGMASKPIIESRDRIRSAIRNSGFDFPRNKKIIVSLAPSEMSKNSTSLDLPIALSILSLSGQLLPQNLSQSMFTGELALDGTLRPIRGILNIVEAARKLRVKRLYIPAGNSNQASLITDDDIEIYPIKTIRELWLILKQIKHILPLTKNVKNTETDNHNHYLDEVINQPIAKRALIIAIAGRHNILLFGQPGTGKTMLAQIAPSLLPPPTLNECIEITKLHSIIDPTTNIATSRPFRAPHHSISITSMLGGGQTITPGEISLAHCGILFLDEFSEFHRDIIEALRVPLEKKSITINRASGSTSFPADFILIAATNPCPCGYAGSSQKMCSCSPKQLQNYRKKLSGPILDRIDMTIHMAAFDNSVLLKNTTISTLEHTNAKLQIRHALNKQFKRYHNSQKFNGNLNSRDISRCIKIEDSAKKRLDSIANSQNLSARSYLKLIKLAQTIADICPTKSSTILEDHILEAFQYRNSIE